MAPKLAYVEFRDDHVRYVVPIQDILNYFPNHATDFDEKTLYSVLWPLLPKDGSFSTDSYYSAYIKCLGDSYEDIYYKVNQQGMTTKSKKLKMPQNLAAELKKERAAAAAEKDNSAEAHTRNHSKQSKETRTRLRERTLKSSSSKSKESVMKMYVEKSLASATPVHTIVKEVPHMKTKKPTKGSDKVEKQNNTALHTPDDDCEMLVPVSPASPSGSKSPKSVASVTSFDVREETSPSEVHSLQKELAHFKALAEEMSHNNKKLTQDIQDLELKVSVDAKKTQQKPKAKKRKALPELQKDYKTCLELAPMIRDDLTRKVPLNTDNNDNVHIGNGVYIPQDLFNDKVRKAKGSIAVRDLAQHIWATEGLASRSLVGGICPNPKSQASSPKSKATPKKVEAILGVYCGKLLADGFSEKHLPLGVKTARSVLQQKFKESSYKVQVRAGAGAAKRKKLSPALSTSLEQHQPEEDTQAVHPSELADTDAASSSDEAVSNCTSTAGIPRTVSFCADSDSSE